MYIIDRLKNDYPQHESTINEFDMFIKRYHSAHWVTKIFDDQKPSFHFINEAYKIGPGNPGYTRNMAYFEKSLNEDTDFLQFFIQDMFDDNSDYSNLDANALKDIIDKHYMEYKGI